MNNEINSAVKNIDASFNVGSSYACEAIKGIFVSIHGDHNHLWITAEIEIEGDGDGYYVATDVDIRPPHSGEIEIMPFSNYRAKARFYRRNQECLPAQELKAKATILVSRLLGMLLEKSKQTTMVDAKVKLFNEKYRHLTGKFVSKILSELPKQANENKPATQSLDLIMLNHCNGEKKTTTISAIVINKRTYWNFDNERVSLAFIKRQLAYAYTER